jgi:hypothetical protein
MLVVSDFFSCLLKSTPRCDTSPENLGGDAHSILRTRQWTDRLVADLDPDVLWTRYGVDDEAIAGSLFRIYRRLQATGRAQPAAAHRGGVGVRCAQLHVRLYCFPSEPSAGYDEEGAQEFKRRLHGTGKCIGTAGACTAFSLASSHSV